jgi:hypothetical protein
MAQPIPPTVPLTPDQTPLMQVQLVVRMLCIQRSMFPAITTRRIMPKMLVYLMIKMRSLNIARRSVAKMMAVRVSILHGKTEISIAAF